MRRKTIQFVVLAIVVLIALPFVIYLLAKGNIPAAGFCVASAGVLGGCLAKGVDVLKLGSSSVAPTGDDGVQEDVFGDGSSDSLRHGVIDATATASVQRRVANAGAVVTREDDIGSDDDGCGVGFRKIDDDTAEMAADAMTPLVDDLSAFISSVPVSGDDDSIAKAAALARLDEIRRLMRHLPESADVIDTDVDETSVKSGVGEEAAMAGASSAAVVDTVVGQDSDTPAAAGAVSTTWMRKGIGSSSDLGTTAHSGQQTRRGV